MGAKAGGLHMMRMKSVLLLMALLLIPLVQSTAQEQTIFGG